MSKLAGMLDTWAKPLNPLLSSEAMLKLGAKLADFYNSSTVYPEVDNIFKAFQLCKYDNLKVVILGQDPYHDGRAIGLSFGNKEGTKVSPSLQIIKKELEQEYGELGPFDHSLKNWAKQGVLLLNTALTVKEGSPGSHLEHWEFFTKGVLELICKNNSGVIFILWGKKAQAYRTLEMTHFHHVLESAHPAAELRRKNAGFLGNGHFKRTNDLINMMNGEAFEINWLN